MVDVAMLDGAVSWNVYHQLLSMLGGGDVRDYPLSIGGAMRERDETLLVDLIAIWADRQPDLDVLTFERLSADGRPDEIRTYADLHRNGQRIAAWLIARGLAPGERFALMMRNHPEFVETMIAASATACVMVPSVRKSGLGSRSPPNSQYPCQSR